MDTKHKKKRPRRISTPKLVDIEKHIILNTQDMKYQLYDKVTESYYQNEIFTIVGIRPHELELQGDWSGGTHAVCQRSWVDIKDVKPYKPKNN